MSNVLYLMNFTPEQWEIPNRDVVVLLNSALRTMVNGQKRTRESIRVQMVDLMWAMREHGAYGIASLSFVNDVLNEIFGDVK